MGVTKLSVNLNKIALLRNSRGRNFPDLSAFAVRCLDLGAHGITLHPRQDQRHARYSDVDQLAPLCRERGNELNVEGYPSDEFLARVVRAKPAQCTLVPDAASQLTSDHGWNVRKDLDVLRVPIRTLRDAGIRVSLFCDHDAEDLPAMRALGADRVELYTGPYAEAFDTADFDMVFDRFLQASRRARDAQLGVNAGHDLNLQNLARLLTIPGIDEVSIGHALIVECIELGIETVLGRYVEITAGSSR